MPNALVQQGILGEGHAGKALDAWLARMYTACQSVDKVLKHLCSPATQTAHCQSCAACAHSTCALHCYNSRCHLLIWSRTGVCQRCAVTDHASLVQSVHRASGHIVHHHALDSHTREKLLGGDALRERGIRQGLPCQAQLLPLHAVHSLEVASRYLHVLHTQFVPTAALTGPLACTHGSRLSLGLCTHQACYHLLAVLLSKSTIPVLHMHGQVWLMACSHQPTEAS